jgi:hypothetical protein
MPAYLTSLNPRRMYTGVLHLSASIMMASWVRKVFNTYETEQLATYTIDAHDALLYVIGKLSL